MSDLFAALREALRERRAVIADHAFRDRDPAAHLEALKGASERIQTLQAQLPAGVDPHFRHYLQQCSYDKALAWLGEA